MQNTEKGFTLIETLVAMTLFAIGVLALSQVQFAASRNGMSSRTTSQATFLASDRLEEIVHGPVFDDMTAGNYPSEDYSEVAGGDDRYTRFKRTTTIQDSLDVVGRITMKTVTVEVAWQASNGERNVTLQSRISRF